MFKLSNTSGVSIFTALCLTLPAPGNAAGSYAPRVEFGARLEPSNRIIHGVGQDAKGFRDYAKNFDHAHQPLLYMTYMIGEMTPRHVGVLDGQKSWDRWFAPMIDLLKRRPEIKATAYINWEWREWSDRIGFSWHDWGDARIERNAVVRDRWVAEHSNPIYLHASTDTALP